MTLFSLLTNSSAKVISELLFTFSPFLQKICLITYGLLFCASAIFASLSFLAVQGLQNICGVKCNFLPGIGQYNIGDVSAHINVTMLQSV